MEGSQQVTICQLPAGFRFHPTDQELINCYLHKKVTSSLPSEWDIIAHIDLYKFNPWDLPSMAFFGEREWFFFSPRDRKYPNGIRPNRAAASGYWKATGTDKPILAGGGTQCIGVKKALVFYVGKPPKGMKTEWVMHEFRLLDSMAARSPSQKQSSMRLDDWVLCRVRQKGSSPAATDVAEEACCPNHSILTFNAQMEEKQKVLMDITSLTKWCDNQLLNYPTESTIEDSNPAYFSRHSYVTHHITGGHAAPAQPRCSAESTITASESMKRKISPCALDEALFLQAGKRMRCSADGLLSPAESVSVNQEFPEFFI